MILDKLSFKEHGEIEAIFYRDTRCPEVFVRFRLREKILAAMEAKQQKGYGIGNPLMKIQILEDTLSPPRKRLVITNIPKGWVLPTLQSL